MFRASSFHLQEDTVVYMQHMVLSQFVVACRYTACVRTVYYSPVHVSSLKCSYSGEYSCIHAAYCTVTVRGGLSVHSLSENCVLFSCTCFEPQVLIFRRIQLYTCSIWYCHSLGEFVVACRYTA